MSEDTEIIFMLVEDDHDSLFGGEVRGDEDGDIGFGFCGVEW